jgi:hypothetical protein
LEANLDQDIIDTNQITENEMSATNSSNDSSDESQESCGKCVVSTDYLPLGECGSSTSDIDDQMREEPLRDSSTVHEYANANDVHTNAQLSNYQSTLAMSDTQKSQVVDESQILMQRCAQAVIFINDVNSPLQVATGEEKSAADLAIDITETEALATMESHSVHVQHAHKVHALQVHPHAHVHHQVHSPHTGGHHHHANHESMTQKTPYSRSEEKWESHFTDLAAYKEQHGNCLVPTSTKLGGWLRRQRHSFRNKNLKEDRKQHLMELDKTCLGERIAEFSAGTITDADENHAYHESMTLNTAGLPSRLEEKWESRFRDLAAYKEQHGNCLVPHSTKLGSWFYRQRYNFGHKNLKEERKQRLMELDKTCFKIAEISSGTITDKDRNVPSLAGMPALHAPPPVNCKRKHSQAYESKLYEKWNIHFMELVEYKKKNGHCNSPTRNGSLGSWIHSQRTFFKSNKLKADRYEKLVGIGFVFEGDISQKWQDMYEKLLEHKETKGPCFDVPSKVPLGRWLREQRWRCRNGKLREDRAEKLVSVGFDLKTMKFIKTV